MADKEMVLCGESSEWEILVAEMFKVMKRTSVDLGYVGWCQDWNCGCQGNL